MIKEKNQAHIEWIESAGQKGKQLVLDEFSFQECDMKELRIDQARITASSFDQMQLLNEDLHLSVLCSTSFRETTCDTCDFYRTDLSYTDFKKSNIRNCNFTKGDLSEASFMDTKIVDTKLVNTLLYLTNFENAIFDTVDVSMADFDETIVKGIRLINVTGMEDATFESINIGDEKTPILLYGDDAKKWMRSRMDS